MQIRLTKRSVETIAPAARDVYGWDDKVPGFGVKVTPKGLRIYVLKYRVGAGQRWLTLGRHGDVTVEEARRKAKKARGLIADRKDPAAERDADKAALTVKQLGERYIAEHAKPHKKPASAAEDERNLERHVYPELGALKVPDVKRQDVLKLHHKLRETPIAANRTLALVSKMFSLAEEWGLRPERSNPCWKVKKFRENRRDRFLTLDEIKRLGNALAELEAGIAPDPKSDAPRLVTKSEYARRRGWSASYVSKLIREGDLSGRAIVGKGRKARIDRVMADEQLSGRSQLGAASEHPIPIAVIRLLLLTGCRAGEILALQWQHVDFENACLRLPDSKTGAKVVHLGAPALDVLAGLPRWGEGPFVFPRLRAARTRKLTAGHFSGLEKAWQRIRQRAELDGVRLHDLRHTFASWSVMGGASLHLTGALLGHRQPQTTARYAHLADDPLKAAADKVAGTLAAAMASTSAGAEVVPLRKGRDAQATRR